MALAGHTPHGSERAELPHSALVSSGKVQPLGWIRIVNPRIGQIDTYQPVHPFREYPASR